MNTPVAFLRSLPRWYLIALVFLFGAYAGGWLCTIHLAQVERAAGAPYVMPLAEHDPTSYANLTESILHGSFYDQNIDNTPHDYFHTPGYPAFAAAILLMGGGSFFAVTFVQILLVFATALMTAALGARLVSARAGQWASLLFLCNPVVPYNALYVLTDVLFMFLLTLGFLTLVFRFERRPVWAALAAGIIFAAAIYVRPVGFIGVPIFLALIAALRVSWRKKVIAGTAMLAVIGLLLLPWMLRNRAESGVFAFSSLVPFDMAYVNLPHFWADTQGLPLEDGYARVEQQSGVPEGQDANGRPLNWYNLASSPALEHYELGVILHAPVRYGVWHLFSSTGFFLNPAINPPEQHINLKQALVHGQFKTALEAVATPWWFLLERVGIGLGLLFIAAGAWALRRKPLMWAFLFIIVYLAALGGPSAQARYRLPVEPLIAVIMTAGIAAALRATGVTKAPAPH